MSPAGLAFSPSHLPDRRRRLRSTNAYGHRHTRGSGMRSWERALAVLEALYEREQAAGHDWTLDTEFPPTRPRPVTPPAACGRAHAAYPGRRTSTGGDRGEQRVDRRDMVSQTVALRVEPRAGHQRHPRRTTHRPQARIPGPQPLQPTAQGHPWPPRSFGTAHAHPHSHHGRPADEPGHRAPGNRVRYRARRPQPCLMAGNQQVRERATEDRAPEWRR